MNPNQPDALIILAKWPEPGKVKTRLSPPLAPADAASLYRCMLHDTLVATSGLPGVNRLIFFDGPAEHADDFKKMATDATLFRQLGKDLGERLIHAFETAFSTGSRYAAAIGTDSPHMPADRITQAFSLLNGRNTDVVFGPAEDGGYYLVGMRDMHRELFRDIPWSTHDVMTESLARAESAGLSVAMLPSGFDLDSADDLLRLKEDPAAAKMAPETVSLSARLIPT